MELKICYFVLYCLHSICFSQSFSSDNLDEFCYSSGDANNDKVCRKNTESKNGLNKYRLSETKHIFVDKNIETLLEKSDRIEYFETKDSEMPFFIDSFGIKHDWMNLEDGWTLSKRNSVFKEHKRVIAQPKWVPKLTKNGYKKMKIPEDLYKIILDNRLVEELENESCSFALNCHDVLKFSFLEFSEDKEEMKDYVAYFHNGNTKVMKWRNETDAEVKVNLHLKPILERWIGGDIPLTFSEMFGVRRYLNGSSLVMHVDRLETHVISAILQIDQDADDDWPLAVVNHKNQKKKISLKPGEMLLYESATIPHGKPYRFNGKYFDNLFLHYRPRIWYNTGDKDFPLKNEPGVEKLTIEQLKQN